VVSTSTSGMTTAVGVVNVNSDLASTIRPELNRRRAVESTGGFCWRLQHFVLDWEVGTAPSSVDSRVWWWFRPRVRRVEVSQTRRV
jgi:hypothetical protein